MISEKNAGIRTIGVPYVKSIHGLIGTKEIANAKQLEIDTKNAKEWTESLITKGKRNKE